MVLVGSRAVRTVLVDGSKLPSVRLCVRGVVAGDRHHALHPRREVKSQNIPEPRRRPMYCSFGYGKIEGL